MLKFIIKRLLYCSMILLIVMFVIYVLMTSLPSGYIENTARTLANSPNSTRSVEEWVEILTQELDEQVGSSKGPVKGFFHWLGNVLHGEFGNSWKYTIPVTEKFNDVIWYSFALAFVAFVAQTLIAIPLGILAAKKQYSVADYSISVVALVGISMPTFFLASLLQIVFAIKLDWFDLGGMVGRNSHLMGDFERFLDTCHHFVLPVITLIIIGIGSLMRYTRTNTLEVLNADYIRTARAKGLSEKRVIGYHAFRNTLIPIVTIVGGSLPGLFSGALITETLFDIRGIGYVSYHCMNEGDIPFTMFYLTFSAILTLLGTLISDILYAVVDPRVRLS